MTCIYTLFENVCLLRQWYAIQKSKYTYRIVCKCMSRGLSSAFGLTSFLSSYAAQLRLVNGLGQCSGRVEVFYKGQWGTVCDDEWELVNADVVCGQLGCGHAVSAPTGAHFGRGTGPIWLDNVVCAGQESALTHCGHNNFGDNNCGHGEDAGVICLGKSLAHF